MGPDTVFTSAKKRQLTEWLTDLIRYDIPQKVDKLLNIVQNIGKKPFKYGHPGKKVIIIS